MTQLHGIISQLILSQLFDLFTDNNGIAETWKAGPKPLGKGIRATPSGNSLNAKMNCFVW